jgi:type I restriction enzyme, S subunit
VAEHSWKFVPYPAYRSSTVKWFPRVPKHWKVVRLQHLAALAPSSVDKKTVEGEQLVNLCNYTDVYYNERITTNIEFMLATARREQIDKHTLRAGDVLVTKDSESWDDIAVPAFVPQDLPGVVCGYHLVQIRPQSSRLDGRFLFRCLQASGVREQAWVQATGITRYGLKRQDLKYLMLPLPPISEQRAITAFLDRESLLLDLLMAGTWSDKTEVGKLGELIDFFREYRTALISSAVTGQIDVRGEVAEP